MEDSPSNGVVPDSQVNGVEQDPDAVSFYDGYDPKKGQIRRLDQGDAYSGSFEFTNEDHTLGNALRHVIMKNPEVEFCGYSIPHPAEPKMNMRIQLYDEGHITIYDVLEKGLQDLQDACDVITEKFEKARKEHPKQNEAEMVSR
ncbi:MAG: RNA polymerase subunit AC19 [Chrysothrix sp. TS-e1954]|nr:MAG: RNA polymerase subunit AC19 [Chrysothrix sp. TS-e1954]